MQLPRATRLVIRIAGERMYLWRAVDHEGEVLDMLVQRRRDSRAALRLMRKLLKKQGFAPKLVITDKLRSYAAAFRRLRLTCPHEQIGFRSALFADEPQATLKQAALAFDHPRTEVRLTLRWRKPDSNHRSLATRRGFRHGKWR